MKTLSESHNASDDTSTTFADMVFCCLIIIVLVVAAMAIEISQRERTTSAEAMAKDISDMTTEDIAALKNKVEDLEDKLGESIRLDVLTEKLARQQAAAARSKDLAEQLAKERAAAQDKARAAARLKDQLAAAKARAESGDANQRDLEQQKQLVAKKDKQIEELQRELKKREGKIGNANMHSVAAYRRASEAVKLDYVKSMARGLRLRTGITYQTVVSRLNSITRNVSGEGLIEVYAVVVLGESFSR